MVSEPSKNYSYSGGGYMLAQYAVENITKKEYCKLAEKLILSPFGMKHSVVSMPLTKQYDDSFAIGWSPFDKKLKNGYLIHPELAAAGLWSTPSDLALFGIEILNALDGKSNLISRESAKLMTTLQPVEGTTSGVGFQLLKGKQGIIFGHAGQNIGYNSSMIFCPQTGDGFVVMLNSDIGSHLRSKIVNVFLKELDLI